MKKDCSECEYFDEFHTSRVCHDCKPWGESAEAVQIHNDGTLEVKVPNAHKVGRVLVMDTDSHIGGGLFYPDDAVEVVRCKECKHYSVKGETTQFGFCGYRHAGTDETEPNCQKCAIKQLWKETEKEDLVAVVRCEDCVWSKEWNDNQIFCDRILMRLRENDFCSYGERRK